MTDNHAGRFPKGAKELTADEIYHMVMLHTYQNKSCRQLARQFGISEGKAYEIVARRSNSGCCG